jgi:dolichyl-phosphate-mannose--protein O-mannosyl transferase
VTGSTERVGWPLVRTGILLGLALSTKWNAAYVSTLAGLLVIYRSWGCWREARREPTPANRAGWRAHLIWTPVAFGVVPALVYLASYIPFFATGHDWGQFVELQKQIFSYHSNLEATHTYQSLWWQWPLGLRPVWYSVTYTEETVANVYANGNLLLYWAFVPAVVWVVVRWWRESNPALPILLIGFFGQWLPWALSPRIAFVYHFLPVVPFGALAVAVTTTQLVRRGGAGRWLAFGYLAAVLAWFVYFYPIHANVPLSHEAFDRRLWFDSWR